MVSPVTKQQLKNLEQVQTNGDDPYQFVLRSFPLINEIRIENLNKKREGVRKRVMTEE